MFPDFALFGRVYPTYQAVGLAALIIGAAVAALRAKRFGLKDLDLIMCAVFASVGLVIGGVILHVLVQMSRLVQHWDFFAGDLLRIVSFLFGGMVFYGGLFGAVFGLWAFSKMFKQNFGNVVHFAIPAFPLIHGIMRLGCFAAGCCYGIEHSALGIAFSRSTVAPNNIPFLPVPLYESAMNFIIFIAIWQFSKKERKPLHLLCFYALPYAIGRFALEFLRGDVARGAVFVMSTSQFISILIIIACVVALIYDKRKTF